MNADRALQLKVGVRHLSPAKGEIQAIKRSLLIAVISVAVGVGIYAFTQRRTNHQPAKDGTGLSKIVADAAAKDAEGISEITLPIREWLIHLGYGEADTTRKPFFQLNDPDTRIFTFLPDCERIMAHQQTAQMIHRAWTKFFWEERAIYQYLFQDVVRAGADATAGSRKPSIYWYTADEEYRARLQRLQAGPAQTPSQHW